MLRLSQAFLLALVTIVSRRSMMKISIGGVTLTQDI